MTLCLLNGKLAKIFDCKALCCLAVMKGKPLDNFGKRLQNNGRPDGADSPVRTPGLRITRLGT
jgi:hypothetical protein